jgi:hypothetical protein
LATNPIAKHSPAHVSANGVAHMGTRQGRVSQHQTPQSIRANICSLFGQSGEDLPLAYPADQAESLCRPLARRDFKMARPARVFIRWRKPCFLARRRLFGWKVRFTHASSVRCREGLDNSGRTTYWAERWDYNGKNSTGKTRFFMPVENLLPSLPPPRVGGGVHTLWIVLWMAFDTGSASRKCFTSLGFIASEAHISVQRNYGKRATSRLSRHRQPR